MALADNPKTHILHMFKMQMHDQPDCDCQIFPEGTVIEKLPLDQGEHVYATFRQSFHFTPESLIWIADGVTRKLYWQKIKSCSFDHRPPHRNARVNLIDGTKVSVPMAQLTDKGAFRVAQLFAAMVDRWKMAGRDDYHILTIERFFELARTDDAISPNWYPDHPGLAVLRARIEQLHEIPGVTEVALVVTDYDDDQPCVQEITLVSGAKPSAIAIDALNFSYFGESPARTAKLMGPVTRGQTLFSGIWD